MKTEAKIIMAGLKQWFHQYPARHHSSRMVAASDYRAIGITDVDAVLISGGRLSHADGPATAR